MVRSRLYLRSPPPLADAATGPFGGPSRGMYHLNIGCVVKLRDLDLKRVIWDVEYRREVIAFLNRRGNGAGRRKKEPKLASVSVDGGSNDDPRHPDKKAA
jgi:hypothetical protein